VGALRIPVSNENLANNNTTMMEIDDHGERPKPQSVLFDSLPLIGFFEWQAKSEGRTKVLCLGWREMMKGIYKKGVGLLNINSSSCSHIHSDNSDWKFQILKKKRN
jgi:hypothetical protein